MPRRFLPRRRFHSVRSYARRIKRGRKRAREGERTGESTSREMRTFVYAAQRDREESTPLSRAFKSRRCKLPKDGAHRRASGPSPPSPPLTSYVSSTSHNTCEPFSAGQSRMRAKAREKSSWEIIGSAARFRPRIKVRNGPRTSPLNKPR